MAAEVLFAAAKDKDMPAFLAKESSKGVPGNALLMTTIFIQLILILVIFATGALDFTLDLTAALSLVPFLLAAGYALKITITRDGYPRQGEGSRGRTRELIVAAIAVVYTLFLIWAAGTAFLLLSCILLLPGTILYIIARREKGAPWFTTVGWIVFAAVAIGAIAGVVGLAAGYITI
jgi:arginine:ornithine antiporter/lysine permease